MDPRRFVYSFRARMCLSFSRCFMVSVQQKLFDHETGQVKVGEGTYWKISCIYTYVCNAFFKRVVIKSRVSPDRNVCDHITISFVPQPYPFDDTHNQIWKTNPAYSINITPLTAQFCPRSRSLVDNGRGKGQIVLRLVVACFFLTRFPLPHDRVRTPRWKSYLSVPRAAEWRPDSLPPRHVS